MVWHRKMMKMKTMDTVQTIAVPYSGSDVTADSDFAKKADVRFEAGGRRLGTFFIMDFQQRRL